MAKTTLIDGIGETIKARKLIQQGAAELCRTDQPTLSKVPRGRMESVTIDRLTGWLTPLGCTVEIRVLERALSSCLSAGRGYSPPQR